MEFYQGDIIRISGFKNYFLIVSKNAFIKATNVFHICPVIEKYESLTLSQFTLKEMIRQTIFSIAVNENNRLMTGELFEIKDNVLRVASLDGHRISIRKIELKNPNEFFFYPFIII